MAPLGALTQAWTAAQASLHRAVFNPMPRAQQLTRRLTLIAFSLLLSACAAEPPAASATDAAGTPDTGEASDAEWMLIAIGDSIPYAREDCGGCTSFVQLLARAIESQTGTAVMTRNLSSHDNLTSGRLLNRIKTDATMRRSVAAADMVMVTIGHNDPPWGDLQEVCGQDEGQCRDILETAVDSFASNLGGVLAEVSDLRAGAATMIRVTNQYNDLVGDACCPTEASWLPSVHVKDAFNVAACKVAAEHDAPCVDVYHAFNGADGADDAGPLLAADHTHPSAEGHELIAELIMDTGLAPLR